MPIDEAGFPTGHQGTVHCLYLTMVLQIFRMDLVRLRFSEGNLQEKTVSIRCRGFGSPVVDWKLPCLPSYVEVRSYRHTFALCQNYINTVIMIYRILNTSIKCSIEKSVHVVY